MQNWIDLYTELGNLVALKIPNAKWVDLWHNQVSFLETEHPFPTPAVFLSFRIMNTQDLGTKVQQVRLQVDFYTFFETFADTYRGSVNQNSALDFITMLNAIHANFHGTSGMNYSGMRRIGMAPVDTGSAGNLYVTNFECILIDYSAQEIFEEVQLPENVTIVNSANPVEETEGDNFFKIN